MYISPDKGLLSQDWKCRSPMSLSKELGSSVYTVKYPYHEETWSKKSHSKLHVSEALQPLNIPHVGDTLQ